jgi:ATP-dependent protease ClpP protease subunit
MSKVVTLLIDGLIGDMSRIDSGEGQKYITGSMVSDFLEANKDATEIIVEISSNGGLVTEGYIIRDRLVSSKKKITTVAYNVKSIATVIYMAGSTRKIMPNAEFLIHNPWLHPFDLPWTGLDAADFQNIADEMKAEENRLLNFYAMSLGLDETKKAELKEVMNKNQNMTVKDALEWGFATEEVAETPASSKNSAGKAIAFSTVLMNAVINKQTDMAEKKAAGVLAGIKGKLAAALKAAGLLDEADVKNASISLQDGTTVYCEGELAEGTEVYSDEAMQTPLADGDYTLEDGRSISVSGGSVSVITEANNAATQAAALKLRNATLIKDLKAAKDLLKAEQAKVTKLEGEKKALAESLKALGNQLEEFEKTFTPESEDDEDDEDQEIPDKGRGKEKPGRFSKMKKALTKQYGKR